jgi:hypothetical protein
MGNLKTSLLIYGICQFAIFLIAIISQEFSFSYDTGFIAGLLNLVAGTLLLLVSMILFIAGKKDYGKAVITACGILLLAGTITCSFFPFRLYH